MTNWKSYSAGLLAGLMLLASGCAPANNAQSTPPTNATVASSGEMAPVENVVDDTLTPISGDRIRDGVYPITVDSSSSMFRITACSLTVKDGVMTAVMTMGGTGYRHIFLGTGEEAAAADPESYIPFEETAEGTHTFTVPVSALNTGISCAAFSNNKEKWYDRTLLFRGDSLPLDAYQEGVVTTPQSLHLKDGVYEIEVQLEGGSGKASVASPARLEVKGDDVTATIVWSSSNYDYMKVEGQQYDATIVDDHSTVVIPVLCFDWPMPILADTVAMSVPHEIAYELRFDSASIAPVAP